MNTDFQLWLDGIRSGNPDEVWEAAKDLAAAINEIESELLRILSESAHSDARAGAAYALGISRLCTARETLESALLDNSLDANVRGHAAEALGYLGSSSSVAILINQLRDPDASVVYWSAFALGQIGDPTAIPALRTIADSITDKVYKGHSVASEASDAIDAI